MILWISGCLCSWSLIHHMALCHRAWWFSKDGLTHVNKSLLTVAFVKMLFIFSPTNAVLVKTHEHNLWSSYNFSKKQWQGLNLQELKSKSKMELPKTLFTQTEIWDKTHLISFSRCSNHRLNQWIRLINNNVSVC